MSLFSTYRSNRPSFRNAPARLRGRWSRPVLVVALVLGALLGALFGVLVADTRGPHASFILMTSEGLTGGLVGMVIGLLFVIAGLVIYGFITDWISGALVLGLFAMLVMAAVGGLFGAIIGLLTGALLGALVGEIKTRGGVVIGTAWLLPRRKVLPPIVAPAETTQPQEAAASKPDGGSTLTRS